MKTAISRTWQRLKINIVLITLNNVEQNAKKKYLIYEMCLLFVIFRCPYTLSAAEQRGWFERRSTSKGKYQFFLLFLLKFSVLTHFPKPSVVYIVSLIHWMFRFWASSSLLPGRIGKIMVYFVLASENWKLSDEERVKKACWLCVFWCVNPRLGRTTRGGCHPPPPPRHHPLWRENISTCPFQ